MNTRTVQVFTFDELELKVRDRIISEEREAAWNSWVHWEADELLHHYANLALPGTDNLKVTAWSLEHYRAAVVECDVIDADRFADALGCELPDGFVSLTVTPHYGRGSWVGESDVFVETDDGEGFTNEVKSETLSSALQGLLWEVVGKVSDEVHAMTTDEAITDGLLEAGWVYLADGHLLGSVDD